MSFVRGQASFAEVREAWARATDASTSHEAAAAIRPAATDLRFQIRAASKRLGPASADEIAREVLRRTDRWILPTIVTACSPRRSGLRSVGVTKNSRGRSVQVLSL